MAYRTVGEVAGILRLCTKNCLRVDHDALKTGSEFSFTTRKLRFFACFCLA
ncbi:hypothetical protein J2W53_004670 [Pseudomonas frederiksbergensis]|nr:hypothetical protein [Pseudomonas frederiksbergensis]